MSEQAECVACGETARYHAKRSVREACPAGDDRGRYKENPTVPGACPDCGSISCICSAPDPDDPEGLVCIPRDMARLAADGLEVRADDLSDAGSNAYGAGDEERGERLQQRGRDYRRVVRALRDRLKEASDEQAD